MERVGMDDCESAEPIDGVHLALLAGGDRMNVQGFAIDPGATIPEHSHEHEQTGVVYEGELTLLVDGEPIVVGPGDSYAIPGGEPHAAENRTDESVRGVDVFSPPRTDPDWME